MHQLSLDKSTHYFDALICISYAALQYQREHFIWDTFINTQIFICNIRAMHVVDI